MTGLVVVCGLNPLGFRVVEQLHAAGVEVVVVDDEPDRRLLGEVLRLAGGPGGVAVRHVAESARSARVLAAAGLATAAALVLVTDDDLHNVETLLLADELRPGVRTVVRLHRERVGQQVARAMPNVRVLDVSELAASSFVEACVGTSALHHFTIGSGSQTREAVVAEVPAPRDGRLRDLFGDLAPVAVVHADGRRAVCPGRDHAVLAGERVALVGFPEDFAGSGVRPDRREDAARARRRRGAWLRGVRRVVAGLGAELDRPFRVVLGLVLLLATVCVLVTHALYRPEPGRRFGLLDAAYFTVETMATVGFGDYSYAQQSNVLKAFGTVAIVLGAVMVATSYAFITNLLVSRRLERSLGRRRIEGVSAHVVVCGLGSVGVRVAQGLLAEGRDVVVIERDDANRHLAEAQALGVPVIIGDATSPEVLRDAGLERAAAVAVMTSDHAANLETALTVTGERRQRPVPVVLRMFDRGLAHRVETSFGLHLVRSTSALAAPWFVGAAAGFEVVSTFYVDQLPFLVARIDVVAGGGLDGTRMQDLQVATRVLALARAAEGHRLEHTPRRGDRFAPGDAAYLAGPYADIIAVVRRNAPPTGSPAAAPAQLPATPAG